MVTGGRRRTRLRTAGFYALAATDPDLAWVTTGAGRMLRSIPTIAPTKALTSTSGLRSSAAIRPPGRQT